MIWFILLPVLILLPYLGEVLFRPGSSFTDLLISHYPNAVFLQQTLVEWRQVPLWSPLILSGYPFAANPLSGLWYPPGWLALVFPLPFGFNLVVLLHILWGGLGMYRWLRLERLGIVPALFGALAFESMPKIWSHLAAGHLTLIYALAWTPWLLWAERKASSAPKERNILLSPGVFLGVIFLADPRWAAYAGLLWLAYAVWQQWMQSVEREAASGQQIIMTVLQTGKTAVWKILRQVVLALFIAAPLFVPLMNYTRLSTRSMMTMEDSLTLSLPPQRLLGLIIPDPGGYAEWILYPTAIVFILATLALTVTQIRRKTGFWWAIVGLSLLFSLGSAIPGLSLAMKVPGLDLLRVPSRALFLTGFGLAIIAAHSLEIILNRDRTENITFKPSNILPAFGIIVFVILFGGIFWFLQRSLPFNIIWAAISLAAAYILISLVISKRYPKKWIGVLFLCFVLFDAGVINRLSFEPRSIHTLDQDANKIASYLDTQGGQFRIYSPSYSLPQDVAVDHGLALADGVDPLQMMDYAGFMELATGVPTDGYSVTMPPFASGDPKNDNRAYIPDAYLLGLLNVRHVISAYDLADAGLVMQARFGDTRIYENPKAVGEAWVQPSDREIGEDARPVPVFHHGANEIEIKAEGPGLLVLSETAYPGWQVWVDGKKAQVITAQDILRAVDLPAGSHQVRFIFQPWDVPFGIGLALVAWAGLIGVQLFQRRPHINVTGEQSKKESLTPDLEGELQQ